MAQRANERVTGGIELTGDYTITLTGETIDLLLLILRAVEDTHLTAAMAYAAVPAAVAQQVESADAARQLRRVLCRALEQPQEQPQGAGTLLMSDLSVLSHHYLLSYHLCDQLNHALIEVKRWRYQLPGVEAMNEKALETSLSYLVMVIQSILSEVSPATTFSKKAPLQIPPSVIQQLKTTHQASWEHYIDELQQVHERLLNAPSQLTSQDFGYLDEISQSIGIDFGEVSRRMRRR